jgi:periplasmic divalent cation tolerance protein
VAESFLLVRVACADQTEARRIGHLLIQERLAACVHLHPHEAIYRWNGAIETAPEYTLLAKTTQAAFPRLRDRILQVHSYELPAILAVPIAHANPPFLDWVEAEVM